MSKFKQRDESNKKSNIEKARILIGVTGSIACYKTCTVVSQLVKDGHEVRIVATPSALSFVGASTWEGLTGSPVYSDTFEHGKMMSHIELARWADIFLVAPLTASHAAKFANGIADDLVTTLYLAFEKSKPFLIAPAMNSIMWAHPAVLENMRKLKSYGTRILEPAEGRLACGEFGQGKMAEPENLIAAIQKELTPSRILGRVLVVYGGTREPIDAIRYISNLSTGKTGAMLCDALKAQGLDITVLASTSAIEPKTLAVLDRFESAVDLQQKLTDLISSETFDAVIQLAAVGDFRVEKIRSGGADLSQARTIKIGSEKSLTIELGLNPKVVEGIKRMATGEQPLVIAFKLTNTKDRVERDKAIAKLLASSNIDYVVHNDLLDIDKSTGRHEFCLYGKAGKTLHCPDVQALAEALSSVLKQKTKISNRSFEVFHDSLS